jgi:hypothetical protein
MKSLFLLLLSFFTFNCFSMERLSRLAALPVVNEDELISFEQLPNPSEPAPLMPLRLWQNPQNKARLELPLVEAKIKLLEKKHAKEKKAFNKKREVIADHAMYAVGYIAVAYALHKIAYENNTGFGLDVFHRLNKWVNGGWDLANKDDNRRLAVAIDFCDAAFIVPTFLAAKNSIQVLWKSPHLFGAPKESEELLAARQERNQLFLTLQQAPEQS